MATAGIQMNIELLKSTEADTPRLVGIHGGIGSQISGALLEEGDDMAL
jgi:hypothetical protein